MLLTACGVAWGGVIRLTVDGCVVREPVSRGSARLAIPMHDFLLEVSQGRYKGVSAGTVRVIEMSEEGKEQTKIFVARCVEGGTRLTRLGTCGAQMEWPSSS